MGRAVAPKHLELTDCLLTELPRALQEISSLKRLFLHGNAGLGIPEEVLGPPSYLVIGGQKPAEPANILAYYYFRLNTGSRPLNEAKLILVGRGGVGKTSLVNRLVHGRYDRDEKKTEGIQITNWRISLSDGKDARLNVWDFGGQEIMHATHQSFSVTAVSIYWCSPVGAAARTSIASIG